MTNDLGRLTGNKKPVDSSWRGFAKAGPAPEGTIYWFFVFYYRETNGNRPMNRARFTASASGRWYFELTPVLLREITRP